MSEKDRLLKRIRVIVDQLRDFPEDSQEWITSKLKRMERRFHLGPDTLNFLRRLARFYRGNRFREFIQQAETAQNRANYLYSESRKQEEAG